MIPLGLTREQYDKLSKFVDSNSDLHEFLSMIEEMIRVNETDEQLNEYTAHIENNTHTTSEALELYNKLVEKYGANHQKILDLNRLVRWQNFKIGLYSPKVKYNWKNIPKEYMFCAVDMDGKAVAYINMPVTYKTGRWGNEHDNLPLYMILDFDEKIKQYIIDGIINWSQTLQIRPRLD